MIYLSAESKSSIGDDTFWTWFERTFESSWDIPRILNPTDAVLHYSVLGAPPGIGGKKVGLLWELYPEMIHQKVEGSYEAFITKISACEKACDFNVVPSTISKEFYGPTYELPIGVDTDLFCPRNKQAMRQKHGFNQNDKLGFWCGTRHHMKGMDRLFEFSREHPQYQWIVVDKWNNTKSQRELAELMNCADIGLFTGRLRPYFMIEFEMMASDLPIIDISGMQRDFMPGGRKKIFEIGWSRYQAKETWHKFLKNTVKADVNFL